MRKRFLPLFPQQQTSPVDPLGSWAPLGVSAGYVGRFCLSPEATGHCLGPQHQKVSCSQQLVAFASCQSTVTSGMWQVSPSSLRGKDFCFLCEAGLWSGWFVLLPGSRCSSHCTHTAQRQKADGFLQILLLHPQTLSVPPGGSLRYPALRLIFLTNADGASGKEMSGCGLSMCQGPQDSNLNASPQSLRNQPSLVFFLPIL